MTPIEVASSQPNCSLPKFIAPRQSGETRNPDRPRFRNPCEAMSASSVAPGRPAFRRQGRCVREETLAARPYGALPQTGKGKVAGLARLKPDRPRRMARAAHMIAIARGWFVTLAALALTIQLLVPQGYMVSTDQGSPGLVICTGHGPLRLYDHHRAPGKAPKSSDAPCAFAGHGTATAPPPAASPVAVSFEYVQRPLARTFDLAPGRGLAAPPPPSHAPPSTLI